MADERPVLPPRMPPPPLAPLPPPPLAHEYVPDPAAVPLPWTTPLMTLLAGAIAGGAAVLVMRLVAHSSEEWHLLFGTLAWYGLMAGLGATAMDHWAPGWPPIGRWALGVGLAALLPDPVIVVEMAVRGRWDAGFFSILGLAMGVLFGLFGVALGWARSSGEDLVWKLPLARLA